MLLRRYTVSNLTRFAIGGGAGFRLQRAAALPSTNQLTAASPLHTGPDSPGEPTLTEPPIVSAGLQFL